MDVMPLTIPVQETSGAECCGGPRDVGLSVEESHPEESKLSSVDHLHCVAGMDSSEVHNSPPSPARVSRETQTDFVSEENDQEPEVKTRKLEDMTSSGSSDIVDQQKTSPGEERRDEKKRRRKRKKRPVMEGREMVSPPTTYPKTQSQALSLQLSAMVSDIFSKLAVRVIFFLYLFGPVHATISPPLTGPCQVHIFATDSSLFDTHLLIKIDEDILCDIPPANLTRPFNCTHNGSTVYLINSTSLLLITTPQSGTYFLEYGPKVAATPKLADSFNTIKEALQHFHLENTAPPSAGNATAGTSLAEESAPGWVVALAVILAVVVAGVVIAALLLKYCKCPGENFRMKKGYSKGQTQQTP